MPDFSSVTRTRSSDARKTAQPVDARPADADAEGKSAAAASGPTPPGTAHADRLTDLAIIGGGCSGLALALQLANTPGCGRVLVLEGRSRPDPRVWCSWDDGSDPVPEARSASWSRWEIRTRNGVSTGVDEDHPYCLVRAEDRRAAIMRRLANSPAIASLAGAAVHSVSPSDGRLLLRTAAGTVSASRVIDATGDRAVDAPPGRMLLHQRFLGLWIRTQAAIFDESTVTLMDFTGQNDATHHLAGHNGAVRKPTTRPDDLDGTDVSDGVRFVYVLPISPTEALIESTVFSPSRHAPIAHRDHIEAYLLRRWGLTPDDWQVTSSESGSIPMTDARPRAGSPDIAVLSGLIRPSSGYGYARAHRHAPVVARHLLAGTRVPPFRDGVRTRALDAVFLRFLRDRPDAAPEAFRRLFTLPGPLVVRFLTERSTLLDELRIVLALPIAPFLSAALRTVRERLSAALIAGAAGRKK